MGFFDLFKRKKKNDLPPVEKEEGDVAQQKFAEDLEAQQNPREDLEAQQNSADSWDADSMSLSLSKDLGSEEMSKIAGSDRKIATDADDDSISNESITKGTPIADIYEVVSDAIKGGMGSVWKVHHKGWNTDLAMKRPQPKYFTEGSEERKKNFIHECESWINLGLHPNIVSCYYVREIGGVPSIFSEWMENGSLQNRIKDRSLYAGTDGEVQARLLDIAIQFARGLHYAHESEGHLIHQDVKPDNLLLTKNWDAKVSDFGLARARIQLTDGRTAASLGATHNDIIDVMVGYGAVTAGMLDGGSSAMMYYRDWYTKYNVDVNTLDENQRKGMVNKFKAFTPPRFIPTYFMVTTEEGAS
jgi:hypothetical protein